MLISLRELTVSPRVGPGGQQVSLGEEHLCSKPLKSCLWGQNDNGVPRGALGQRGRTAVSRAALSRIHGFRKDRRGIQVRCNCKLDVVIESSACMVPQRLSTKSGSVPCQDTASMMNLCEFSTFRKRVLSHNSITPSSSVHARLEHQTGTSNTPPNCFRPSAENLLPLAA